MGFPFLLPVPCFAKCTKRGKAYLTFFFTPLGKPTSAPSGHLLPEEGGRMVKAIYPLSVEGGCPKGRGASFFAAKPPSLSLPPYYENIS